jgi:hypothetical protein
MPHPLKVGLRIIQMLSREVMIARIAYMVVPPHLEAYRTKRGTGTQLP